MKDGLPLSLHYLYVICIFWQGFKYLSFWVLFTGPTALKSS